LRYKAQAAAQEVEITTRHKAVEEEDTLEK
jgi:hypothetical protein